MTAGKTPLKVMVFNSSLRVGGAESMSIALANALATEGAKVWFASAGGALRDNLASNVTYLITDNPNAAPVHVAHEMSKYLRHFRPDVLHSHGGMCSLVAAIAQKASLVPCVRVLTHHSRIFRRAPRWISGPVMRRCADHYIAISHDKQKDLLSLGIAPERISLIPNFVDVDAIATRMAGVNRDAVRAANGIPAHARVLMMAGRVIAAKRFDVFVRVAAEVARRTPDTPVHALVVGDGPELQDLRAVVRRESAPATVHLVGYQRDVLPFLAASDIVVFPTAHPEVLPMFLIEASAAGRPIVCSDIPGNREVVTDGETGRVIKGDVIAFAEATLALLRDGATAARFATAAHTRARERFDRAKVAQRTMEMYARLVASRA